MLSLVTDGPSIVEDDNIRLAEDDHWLHRQGHTGLQIKITAFPELIGNEVRHLRVLVHAGADAMPDKFSDTGHAVFLDMVLHSSGDVGPFASGADFLDGDVQGFLGDAEELRARG